MRSHALASSVRAMSYQAESAHANLGPGFLVTAAFIGPGTILTASRAGAEFGLSLLWALLFSLVMTFVLQEMALRLGLVKRLALTTILRDAVTQPVFKWGLLVLVGLAIVVGNSAYEGGNLTGAAAGAALLFGGDLRVWLILLAFVCALLLLWGRYQSFERILVVLVALMAAMFSLSAVVMVLNSEVADIRLLPSAPSDRSEWIVLALIGTTVVPYNLFLHASLVQRKWADGVPLDQAISAARRDLAISLAIGGIVTIAVMVTAAYLYRGGAAPSQLSDLPAQLAPVAGPFAEMAFALGLLAAGLSSALTAPLAASLTLEGAFHRDNQPSRRLFRSTWALVLLCGAGFAVTSQQPVELILIAQVTNALLLPLLALILIVLAARTSIMGQHASRAWQSGVAVLAAMVCGYLSVQRFL